MPASFPGDAAAVLHELQVHQIELEMQNEELRRAQFALAESHERYVDLYDFAPVGYLTLNAHATIEKINLTAAELLGEARKILLQQPFARYLAADDSDRWHLFVQQLIRNRNRSRRTIEVRLQRSDGRCFPARIDGLPAKSDSATPVLNLTLIDIGLQKAVEQQLATMTDNLETLVAKRSEQLRAVSLELILTEERERRDLAQDLHDDLSQLLFAIKIKLSSPEIMPQCHACHEVAALIDQVDHSVRKMTLRLFPPILNAQGLLPALTWLADEMARIFHLTVQIDDDGRPKPLDARLHALIVRSVRELLINSAKHAKVGVARVSCLLDDEQLVVAVGDEGCGFDSTQAIAKPTEHGFGLRSIRERFAMLGGAMDIDSSPGNGATVTLTLRLSAIAWERRRP